MGRLFARGASDAAEEECSATRSVLLVSDDQWLARWLAQRGVGVEQERSAEGARVRLRQDAWNERSFDGVVLDARSCDTLSAAMGHRLTADASALEEPPPLVVLVECNTPCPLRMPPRTVFAGPDTWLAVMTAVFFAPGDPLPAFAALHGLTCAQQRVLGAALSGLDPQETADLLSISVQTVYVHWSEIWQRTRLGSREAVIAGVHSTVLDGRPWGHERALGNGPSAGSPARAAGRSGTRPAHKLDAAGKVSGAKTQPKHKTSMRKS